MSIKRRPLFQVEEELAQYSIKMQEATMKRDYTRIQLFAKQISKLKNEIADIQDDQRFFEQEKNMDPIKRMCIGKTLAIMLNMADLSIYYYDVFMKHFKQRGFRPNDEWVRKAKNLKKSSEEFRKYVAHFFKDENLESYFGQMSNILYEIAKKCYTDRERKYLEELEK